MSFQDKYAGYDVGYLCVLDEKNRPDTGPRCYKTFFMLSLTEHEFIMLIPVKMPPIVGVLAFISMTKTT